MHTLGERIVDRRRFLQMIAASGSAVTLAGCSDFDPPDTQPPATRQWAAPLADSSNTASNGRTTYFARDFGVPWSTAGNNTGMDQSSLLPPAMARGAVFATYPESGLARHDSETGDVEWFIPTGGSGTELTGRLTTTPVFLDSTQTLVVGSTDETLSGIDAVSGSIVWQVTTTDISTQTNAEVDLATVKNTLTVDGSERVLVADESGGMVQLDGTSGSVLGATQADLGTITGPPVLTDGAVISTYTRGIQSVSENGLNDKTENAAVWTALLPDTTTTYRDVPAIHHSGIVVLATESGLIGIDATPDNRYNGDVVQRALGYEIPRMIWEADIGAVTGHGTRVGNIVVFPRTEGGQNGLVAVTTGTGTVVWSRAVSGGVSVPPVSSKGIIYVVDGSGRLQIIDALTGETVEATEIGVSDGSIALSGNAMCLQTTSAVDADERIEVSNGETRVRKHTVTVTGDESRVTLEHLHDNILAVAREINEKTATRVVPRPLEDEDATNVIDEAARQILDAYDSGALSYGVARGVFERLSWVLHSSDLLLTATRARRPERDRLFLFNSSPTELTGYNTDNMLVVSQSGLEFASGALN